MADVRRHLPYLTCGLCPPNIAQPQRLPGLSFAKADGDKACVWHILYTLSKEKGIPPPLRRI